MKVLILKGLPASGKSTYAKELVKKGGWVRTNKDDLRALLHASVHSKSKENFVLDIRDFIIKAALTKGLSVVVDDTNFNPYHEETVRAIAKEFNTQVEVKDFYHVPIEECIARDLYRPNSVGEKVIRGMYNQYIKEVELKANANPFVPKEGKPAAIIVDIDGTLAHMVDRGPFEFSKAWSDRLDETVAHVVKTYHDLGYKIIICSGRDDTDISKEVTKTWLDAKEIPYDVIFMRDHTRVDEKGGKVHDNIIKREIFDEFIRDKYDVKFVLDDRNQVVDMWRNELGLKVLQVAEGNF